MSDLNVKVGLIGKLDMLKFKNMSKTREKATFTFRSDITCSLLPTLSDP